MPKYRVNHVRTVVSRYIIEADCFHDANKKALSLPFTGPDELEYEYEQMNENNTFDIVAIANPTV